MSEHTDYMLLKTDEPTLTGLRDKVGEVIDGVVIAAIPVADYTDTIWATFDLGSVSEEDAEKIGAETQAVWEAKEKPCWVPVSVVRPWPDGIAALGKVGPAIWLRVQEGGQHWRIVVAEGERLWAHLMTDKTWDMSWRDEDDDALLANPAPTEGADFEAMAEVLGVEPAALAETLKMGRPGKFMELIGAEYLETHDQSYLAVTGATGVRFEWDR